MSVDLIRQNFGSTLLTVALLLGLFWLRNELAMPAVSSVSTELPWVGRWLQEYLVGVPYLSAALSIGSILLSGILLTQLMITNMVLNERSYLPAILYVIIACGSYLNISEPIPYLVSLLLILSYLLFSRSFSRQTRYQQFFNASLCIGITLLLYPPAVVFAPILFIALVVFRKGWRDLVIGLGGLLLPISVASYIYWGMGHSYGYLFTESFSLLTDSLRFREQFLTDILEPDLLVYWGILAIVFISMLINVRKSTAGMRTRPTKVHLLFCWVLLPAAVLLALPSRSVWDIPLIAAPLTVLLSTFLCRQNGKTGNIFYLLLLLSVILLNVTPFLFS